MADLSNVEHLADDTPVFVIHGHGTSLPVILGSPVGEKGCDVALVLEREDTLLLGRFSDFGAAKHALGILARSFLVLGYKSELMSILEYEGRFENG